MVWELMVDTVLDFVYNNREDFLSDASIRLLKADGV